MTRPCHLLTTLTYAALLISGSALSEETKTKQNTVYKVDFNYPKNNNKIQADSENRFNAENENLRILLYGKGLALFLEPGTIKNTKLQFNDSNQSAKNEIYRLKSQGENFIVCENPSKDVKNNIENDFNNPEMNSISASDRLKRLHDLGYTCIKP